MSIIWRLTRYALGALTSIGLTMSAEAQETRSGLQISLVSDRSAYKVGEPIKLRLSLTNASSQAIKIQPMPPLGVANLVVLDDHGNKVEPNKGASMQFGSGPRLTVQPGERISVRGLKGELIDLMEWGYDLKDPGRYTIIPISPEVPHGEALQRAASLSTAKNVVISIAR